MMWTKPITFIQKITCKTKVKNLKLLSFDESKTTNNGVSLSKINSINHFSRYVIGIRNFDVTAARIKC